MKVLVTGSSGFVGQRVLEIGAAKGWDCLAQVRKGTVRGEVVKEVMVPFIDSSTDWSHALNGVDCIIHCAARVHQMKESDAEALVAYNEVNTLGTLHLARQAADSGVKRFVFLSSIKVNGEFTDVGDPFSVKVNQPPIDPYGKSKFDAEVGLRIIAEETGLEVVIIRPPLVYGPGVKANFQSMMSWVTKGVPLPLGAINNKRSLVFIDNLVDLIVTTVIHRNAVNRTFLVSDDHDVSTTQLLNAISVATSKSPRLLPIPMSWIQFVAKLVGKPKIAQRICGSLQVDISDTKQELNWMPPISFEEGIKQTVDSFVGSET
ncbi:SDR family oxidoreductase [Moritella sp. 36]|uniref:UDP-glucose 4-epimerase family protein n=1 Tax=Moritella sp. 36 TaxID=2746233 RepID=UPI001BABC530|nr:SDR family oxidoreductase [Moritella sp. 36]QUM87866.1 SDR family oxidoreductase [Moritella sp. 36]